MTRFFAAAAAVLLPLLFAPLPLAQNRPTPVTLDAPRVRRIVPFDTGWRFVRDDPQDAARPEFDDAAWRTLDVPHDWSIEGPFDQKNPTGADGAFLPAGIGWYRKTFTVLPEDAAPGRKVWVEFDGVMANSDVYLNGERVGGRPYGYVSFRCDLSGKLRVGPGAVNVVAVRCDNSKQPASRWYAGAGIYRHVRMVYSDAVHLAPWGVFVSTPKIEDAAAIVHVRATVANDSEASVPPRPVSLRVTLVGPDGRPQNAISVPSRSLAGGQSGDWETDITVPRPIRWERDHPILYRAYVEVRDATTTRDDASIPFGIREFHFAPDTGFWLNGKNFKLKGVCLHGDASALGVAVPLSAWERRLTKLKELGVNAIRTSHNPPAPEFLDLCDRMGFLVMDELFDVWTVAKRPYDYHLFFEQWSQTDAHDTILRDRNHPSIILYSVGNEIHDTPQADKAKAILTRLRDTVHEADPTRPVTQALFRPNASHDYDDGLADLLDVVGQNYRERELIAAHEAKPSRKIIGTENTHDAAVWKALRDTPAYAGQFLWTGIDYLGEAGLWPQVANGSGLLDRMGLPHPRGLQRQTWWADDTSMPQVYLFRRVGRGAASPTDPGYEAPSLRRNREVLFPDWSPTDRAPHEETVEVYSRCDAVQLFLNGKAMGPPLPRLKDDTAPRVWRLAFAPGTLRAVGFEKDKPVTFHELRTAGKPARIQLTAERDALTPGWDDVAYVRAEVVDGNGILVPDAANPVTFSLDGPGRLLATDSADNASHESFEAAQRPAYQGRCFAIVRATSGTGAITLTASAVGLTSGSAKIAAVKPVRGN